MNHHYKIRSFKCAFCSDHFYLSGHLKRHVNAKHEIISDRYKCDQCPFKTHSDSIYNIHKAKMHWSTNTTWLALIQKHVDSHMRQSNNKNPTFYCNRGDCNKAFMYIDQLKDHERIHDNNLINCHYCPWKGTTRTHVIDHMNHHYQIRPFKCSFCDVSSYRVDNRNRHEKEVHEKIPRKHLLSSFNKLTQ